MTAIYDKKRLRLAFITGVEDLEIPTAAVVCSYVKEPRDRLKAISCFIGP